MSLRGGRCSGVAGTVHNVPAGVSVGFFPHKIRGFSRSWHSLNGVKIRLKETGFLFVLFFCFFAVEPFGGQFSNGSLSKQLPRCTTKSDANTNALFRQRDRCRRQRQAHHSNEQNPSPALSETSSRTRNMGFSLVGVFFLTDAVWSPKAHRILSGPCLLTASLRRAPLRSLLDQFVEFGWRAVGSCSCRVVPGLLGFTVVVVF